MFYHGHVKLVRRELHFPRDLTSKEPKRPCLPRENPFKKKLPLVLKIVFHSSPALIHIWRQLLFKSILEIWKLLLTGLRDHLKQFFIVILFMVQLSTRNLHDPSFLGAKKEGIAQAVKLGHIYRHGPWQ